MLRRAARGLPPIKWRDEKIDQWRESARNAGQRATAAEREAQKTSDEVTRLRAQLTQQRRATEEAQDQVAAVSAERDALRAEAERRTGPRTGDGATVVQDGDGTMPRADLTEVQVKAIQRAGHAPTVGAAPSDPRAYPSFTSQLFQARRYRWRLADQELKDHPRSEIPKKLQNHALAASHGVQPPLIHAIWTEPDQIDLAALPETFVVKSNGGAGSRGVFPLRRVPRENEVYEIADSSRRRITGAEVVEKLTTDTMLAGPWFAEEMLVPDVGESALPSDIKIYAFYGQIGYGFARRAPLHRGGRRVDQEGGVPLLRRAGSGHRDPWRQVAAGHSRDAVPAADDGARQGALGRRAAALHPGGPVRHQQGIVMGELTLVPGGNQYYVTHQDVRMGRMWEEAEMRLQIDLSRKGRPFRNITGDHPVPENLRPYLPRV